MYKYDLLLVDNLSRRNINERTAIMKYYFELPEAMRIKAHQETNKFLRESRLKKNRKTDQISAEDLATSYYSFLVFTLTKFKQDEDSIRKKADPTDEELKKIEDIRIARTDDLNKHKSSPKFNAIRDKYFKDVHDFRCETPPRSWRWIALHLRTNFNIKGGISYVTVKRAYEEILVEQKIKGILK